MRYVSVYIMQHSKRLPLRSHIHIQRFYYRSRRRMGAGELVVNDSALMISGQKYHLIFAASCK